MCAIAGMINLPCAEETKAKMLATMQRRGPDDHGVFQEKQTTLLHARLAVIDVDRGKQPMAFSCNGETYIIVYNGELYNTDELRQELIKSGHEFASHSDTEVVLHAYVQWKQGCLERFNGIFAFAIWEQKAQRLFVARDRMGVKPFFFKRHEGGLLFASEIKTILQYPTVRAELDEQGAAEILLLEAERSGASGGF